MYDYQKYLSFFNENIKEFERSTRNDLLIILILIFYKVNLEAGKFKLLNIQIKHEGIYAYQQKSQHLKILNCSLEELEGFASMWSILIENNDPKQTK